MGRFSDALLADGERIVLRSRQHGFATVVASGRFWILATIAVLFFLLGRLVDWSVLDWVALTGLVGACAWLARWFVAWSLQDYLVTDRRVIKVEGIVNRRAADSALARIDDAVLHQGPLARVLGYGDLRILARGEGSVDGFRMLAHATVFKKAMMDAKYALEREADVPVPGAPLRASGPAGVRGERAGAVPATRSPGEVMTVLAGLADLRDRGVISPEDYDAKKAELLGRI